VALTHRLAAALPRQLARREHRVDVEASEPGDVAPARLDRVPDRASEELVAAADPEDERVGSFEDGALHTSAAEPVEVGDGGLRAGKDHQVGPAECGGSLDKAHVYAGLDGERVEIGEVREAGEAHDRDVESVRARRRRGDRARSCERERVLGVEGDVVDERQHAEHRHAGASFELAQAVAEERRVAAQLVDHERAHEPPVPIRQQRDGPVQGREHAAAVDVAHDDGGHAELVGATQVHDVVVEEVDSAGLPAPSRITTSKRRRSSSQASSTVASSFGFSA
jgi:hypothetical protein